MRVSKSKVTCWPPCCESTFAVAFTVPAGALSPIKGFQSARFRFETVNVSAESPTALLTLPHESCIGLVSSAFSKGLPSWRPVSVRARSTAMFCARSTVTLYSLRRSRRGVV